MNLKRISDRIQLDQTIVFHSTWSKEELAEIILSGNFAAGRGGGAMLGKGFYANQHLYQAQKGNYGPYILKARVYGIKGFLFLDKDTYETIHGSASDDFVYEQIQQAGLGDKIKRDFIERNKNFGSTARLASPLWDNYGKLLQRHFGGFVYTGNYDKESVVCWFPNRQVEPLAWSDDKGKTWKPISDFKKFDRGTKEANISQDSHEMTRSLQRARDLISKYENYPDDKLAHAIQSQLSRIKDPGKREIRKKVIQILLSEQRPSVVI